MNSNFILSLILSAQAFNAKPGEPNLDNFPVSNFDLLPVIIVIIIILQFIEFVLQIFWVKHYFKYGIVVLKKSFNLTSNFDIYLKDFLDVELLGESTHSPLKIKWIDENKFALREVHNLRLFKFTYTPIMRGLIKVDSENNVINLEGRLNYMLILSSAFIIYLFNFLPFDFYIVLVIMFLFFMWSMFYSIQKKRFISVVQLILNQQNT